LSAALPHPGPHGWIIVNKPAGISSAKAVSLVRRCFNGVKAGHAGTLDPLASGVLPIALGEATKTISYVMTAEKSYHFTLEWGAETQTDDKEGAITRTAALIPEKQDIEAVLPRFVGLIDQVPPDYSAVKIKGRRAYNLARNRDRGTDMSGPGLPALAARQIRIDSLELLAAGMRHARFCVRCGKGAYIRALARDLGRSLGSAAHITMLERRSVGKFTIEDAISLDFFEEIGQGARASDHIIPVLAVLDDIPALVLTGQEAEKLRHGQGLDLDRQRLAALAAAFADTSPAGLSKTAIAVCKGQPVALVRAEADRLVPARVLNL